MSIPHKCRLVLKRATPPSRALGISAEQLSVAQDCAGDNLDDDGISVPGRFFRRLSLPWAHVAEITVGPATARVIAVDGRDQDVNLADAMNADAIRDALAKASAQLGRYQPGLRSRH